MVSELRSIAEKLLVDIDAQIALIEATNQREKLLDQQEIVLAEKQRKFDLDKSNLASREQVIQQEKEALNKQFEDLKKKQIIEERLEAKMLLIKQHQEDLQKEQESIDSQKRVIADKTAKLQDLEKQQQQINESKEALKRSQEALIARTNAVERKEQFVDAEVVRLKKIADSWQTQRQ